MGNIYEYGVLAGYEKPDRQAPKDNKRLQAKTAIRSQRKMEQVRLSKKRRIQLAKRIPNGNGNPEVRLYSNAKSFSEASDREFAKSKSLKTVQGGGCTPR